MTYVGLVENWYDGWAARGVRWAAVPHTAAVAGTLLGVVRRRSPSRMR